MLIHREALELARMTAQDDDGGKFALSCLKVEPDGSVIVCDGVQLVRVNGRVDEPTLFDELIPIEERDAAEAILLPAEAALSFNAALKKRRKKKGELPVHIVLSTEAGGIRLASSDGKVTRRFVVQPPELPFPDYAKLLRRRHSVKRVVFGLDVLMTVLRTLKAAGCESITMDFAEGDRTPVRVAGFSEPMGPLEGVVMPRSEADADEPAS